MNADWKTKKKVRVRKFSSIVDRINDIVPYDAIEEAKDIFERGISRVSPNGRIIYAFGDNDRLYFRFDPASLSTKTKEVIYWLHYMKTEYEYIIGPGEQPGRRWFYYNNHIEDFSWYDYRLILNAARITFDRHQLAKVRDMLETDTSWIFSDRETDHKKYMDVSVFGKHLRYEDTFDEAYRQRGILNYAAYLAGLQTYYSSSHDDDSSEDSFDLFSDDSSDEEENSRSTLKAITHDLQEVEDFLEDLQYFLKAGSVLDMKLRYYFGQGVPSLFELSAGQCRGTWRLVKNLRYKIDY